MVKIESRTFGELVGFPGERPSPPFGTIETHGTTVLALKYDKGILNLGDRRATASNYIMYDKAEKVFALDDDTLVAISGSFARSVEITRYLKHAYKYYARTQLQEMSLEGKLMEVSRSLSGNLSMSMEGIGVFIPVISAFDRVNDEFVIYFYDVMGARFNSGEFAAAGSGSERIRGIFDYVSRKSGPFDKRPLKDVLSEGLIMLDIAAQLDSATGGFERTPPIAKTLTRDGIESVDDKILKSAIAEIGKVKQ